jgi:hypothetical protein
MPHIEFHTVQSNGQRNLPSAVRADPRCEELGIFLLNALFPNYGGRSFVSRIITAESLSTLFYATMSAVR